MVPLEKIINNIDYIVEAGVFAGGYMWESKPAMILSGCAFIASSVVRILNSEPDNYNQRDE